MRGTVAKRLRREVGGQEMPEFRRYVWAVSPKRKNSGRGDILFLDPASSRVSYKIEKKDYMS